MHAENEKTEGLNETSSIFCSKSVVVYSAFFDKQVLKKISEDTSKVSSLFCNKKDLQINEKPHVRHNDENRLFLYDESNNSNNDLYNSSMLKRLIDPLSDAKSYTELIKRLVDTINKTFFIFLLSVMLLMPLMMVSIGVKYLEKCPLEPKVPIYLLVGGVVGTVKIMQTLWTLWRTSRKQRFDQGDYVDIDIYDSYKSSGNDRSLHFLNNGSWFMDGLLNIFLFIWFCLGNYWVFKIYKPNYHHPINRSYDVFNWCHKTCYMFALIQILVCYIIITTTLFVFLIILCFAKCYIGVNNSQSRENSSIWNSI